MLKINRKIEYALIALKHMKSKKEGLLTSAKEICDIYQTPFDPTSRVLQIMTQHGILHAEQGAKGGYKVIGDLSDISLLDLSKLLIGPIEIASCFHGESSSCCVKGSCQIISPMLNLNSQIEHLFDDLIIEELLQSQHPDEVIIRNKPIKVST